MSDKMNSFATQVARKADVVELVLEGDANMSSVDEMGRTLDKLHELATSEPTASVLIDVRNLEFMNSSCFKKFVTWLGRVQGMPPERRYLIRFLSDPTMHWQRRSLHVLQCFAADLVTIET